MTDKSRWLDWALELQAIAQEGLYYGTGPFDLERYERIREIAAKMISADMDIPVERAKKLFCSDVGYVTPKLDTRAAIFRKGGLPLNWTNFSATGMTLANLIVLAAAVLLVFAVDAFKYRPSEDEEAKSLTAFLRSKSIVLLWAAFMVLVVATLVFGMYGLGYDSGSFIYARI